MWTLKLVLLLAAVAPLWWHNFAADAWDRTPPLKVKHHAYARVSNGRLRGFATEVGQPPRSALIFKRIPYAQPPVGKLRFRPLQPARHWMGDWDATVYGPACPSNTSATTSPQESIDEDCLHINVFTDPKCIYGKRKCPVLFYVHGGGFYYDSAVMFSDQHIVEKYASDGAVFVITAYRIGVLASFDVGDADVVPPNLGLEDVIFALKWTKREIGAFGGDSRRITVMGNSGGGFITELLMAHRRVPTSLFQRAIVSSGASSVVPVGAARPLSEAILDWFNCSKPYVGPNKRAQIDCLRRVEMPALLEAQRVLVDERGIPFAPVTPTEDLPVDKMEKLFRQIKPRTLWMAVMSDEFSPLREKSAGDSCREAASWFGYTSTDVHKTCMLRYYPNKSENDSLEADVPVVAQTAAMHAHSLLIAMINTIKGRNEKGSDHRFHSRDKSHAISYYSTFSLANHSHHSDDLLFFFGLHWTNRTYTPAEALMDRYYPRVVKNFLRIGVPEFSWKPVSDDGRGYFDFDFEVSNASVGKGMPRLTRWPHFVADATDDPDGERFWLLDMARVEANARGYIYRPDALNDGADDDNDDNNKLAVLPRGSKRPSWWMNPWWGDAVRRQRRRRLREFFERAKHYREEQQKMFDALRRPCRGSNRTGETDETNKTDGVSNKTHEKWYENYYKNANKNVGQTSKSDDYSSTYQYEENDTDAKIEREAENALNQSIRDFSDYLRRHGGNGSADKPKRPWIKPSKTSAEWALRNKGKTPADFVDDVKKALKDKKKKHEPWIKPSKTSVEWAIKEKDKTPADLVDEVKKTAEDQQRRDEPWIKPSKTSVEWAIKEKDKTPADLVEEVKKAAEDQQRRDEPWIKPSKTSVEWAIEEKNNTPADLVDDIKKAAAKKKIRGEPWIRPSKTSVEWAIRGKGKTPADLVDKIEKVAAKKEKRGEPWIRPSRTSIEWAKRYNRGNKKGEKSDDTYNDRNDNKNKNKWDKQRHWPYNWDRDRHPNRHRDGLNDVLKDLPFVYKYNFTRGSLECAYEARRNDTGQPVRTRLNCKPRVNYNKTANDNNNKTIDDNNNKTTNDNSENWDNYVDNNSENNTNNNNNKNNNNEDNKSNRSLDEEAADGWRGQPCWWCYPSPWWRRRSHKVPKRISERSPNKVELAEKIEDEPPQEPPFWLPFLDFNLVLAADLFTESETFSNGDIVVAGGANNSTGDAPATLTEDPILELIQQGVPESGDAAGGVDLTYYEALDRLRRIEDAMEEIPARTSDSIPTDPRAPVGSASTGAAPVFWLTLSVMALAVAVALIVIAARLLFRFKRVRRGYGYNSRADEYLTETTRMLAGSSGGGNGENRTKYVT